MNDAVREMPSNITSVFIAGIRNVNAKFISRCQERFLEVVHWPDNIPGKKIPLCDCAIIVTDNINHELMNRTKEAYEGKPIYYAANGWAGIQDEFDQDIFGTGVLAILQSPIDLSARGTKDRLTHIVKIIWILLRFYKNREFKVAEMQDCYAALIDSEMTGLRNILAKLVSYGILESTGWGRYKPVLVPRDYYENMIAVGLPVDPLWLSDKKFAESQRSKKQPEPETLELQPQTEAQIAAPKEESLEPQHVLKRLHNEHEASMDLLLEAMAAQQGQINELKAFMEKNIPNIIQHEIRGITRLLGSLVPQLQGLSPDQLEKVEQMLTLFLGMNLERNPEGSKRVMTPMNPYSPAN